MSNKPHGNVGNQNALKESAKDTTIHIRTTTRDKSRYVKQAQRQGMKLSAWITKCLDENSAPLPDED